MDQFGKEIPVHRPMLQSLDILLQPVVQELGYHLGRRPLAEGHLIKRLDSEQPRRAEA